MGAATPIGEFAILGSRRIGRVADYCPVCGGIRGWTVRRRGRSVLGRLCRRLVPLATARCEGCGFEILFDPSAVRAVVDMSDEDDATLVLGTNPEAARRHAGELARSRRIRDGSATTEDRATFASDAIAALGRMLTLRRLELGVDPWMERHGLAVAAAETGMCFAAILLVSVVVAPSSPFAAIVVAVASLLVGGVLYAHCAGTPRYLGRTFAPLAARALAATNLDSEGIRELLRRLATHGSALAAYLDPVDLRRRIEALPR